MQIRDLHRLGTGCGMEVRGNDLRVLAAKSRPAGITVLGRQVIEDFRGRPASEWGSEYAAFCKGLGLAHLAATVCLPRHEIIVRVIEMPRLPAKELAPAVGYQVDGLHPYDEDQVYWAFAPLAVVGKATGPLHVVVVIAERATVDAYANRFDEAGIAVSAFTTHAAAHYLSLRLRSETPPVPLLLADRVGGRLDVYGESAGRPVLSAEFDLSSVSASRALELAVAELRVEEGRIAPLVACGDRESEAQPISSLLVEERSAAEFLPVPLAAPAEFDLAREASVLAVAIESACPRLGWRANLLPPERRKADSRWMWAPTAALVAALMLLGLAFALRPVIQNRNYLAAIETERQRLASLVDNVEKMQTASADARRRVALLSGIEDRTKTDLAILSELSLLIPDTAWLSSLQLDDRGVQIAGEGQSDTSAPMLGIFNESKWLTNAAFSASLTRIDGGGERFQITAARRAQQIPTAAVLVPSTGTIGEAPQKPSSATLSPLEGGSAVEQQP